MDAATQKLVDEAATAAYPNNGIGIARNAITLGERHAFRRGAVWALEALVSERDAKVRAEVIDWIEEESIENGAQTPGEATAHARMHFGLTKGADDDPR